ncbi:uncharacterized protein SPPG_04692 [Spizellomyces punctatus DAOM BR117]|uniref:Uncharacterized protein n=2 Tax=Spizellomyces punctatus (strain DAOM BR117) TaxID=645134 RepID=A0A0L0HGX8_SPIPD|nr:uncharacterized protein SPPG_04692 [Spizellomyces punctatus DAOM BR117]KND00368.1 hypothetical protein SPPG_04692 [Spizellomyces punctatus DAOM BR117]|eukprot:XP_016608407.1 hypothetical protein SPPG_04692 [Spizellomyces punctatus DAOM BR117]
MLSIFPHSLDSAPVVPQVSPLSTSSTPTRNDASRPTPTIKRKSKKKVLSITVNTVNCKYDVVRDCCQRLGYRVVDDLEPWMLFWIDTGVSVERVLGMKPYQKINHFPGMHEICRKDRLARNLGRLSRLFPKDANFFPKTWILPSEWADFQIAHRSSRRRQCYIGKPDHGCQGKGIFLFKSPDDVTPILKTLKGTTSLIVQTYLNRPFLIDGYKFDLRVYVLVASADPLRVFMYRDGLARFATEPYREPKDGNLDNVCMHLTNYAINKHSENFDHATEDGKGSKRSIRSVMRWLTALRGSAQVEALWQRIGEVVVKTLLTVQPQLKRNLHACFPKKRTERERSTSPGEEHAHPPQLESIHNSQCFEILGFDIFVDHKLKPWVLEVNHSPSFTCDSPLDTEIKTGVISDALRLLNLNPAGSKQFFDDQKARSMNRLLGSLVTPSAKRSEGNSDASVTRSTELRSRKPASPAENQHIPAPASQNEPAVSSKSTSSTSSSTPTTPETSTNEELSEEAAQVLATYHAEFSPQSMAVLEAFEDANLGQYERIFPPTDIKRLAHYLLLKKEATNIFSETLSTKRRREHLENKKKKQQQQAEKLLNWRQKMREKSRSMPQLSDGSSTDNMKDGRKTKSATDIYKSNGSRSPLKIAMRAEETRRSRRLQNKQTIKMNVESINDRFFQTLAVQQGYETGIREDQPSIPCRPYITGSGSSGDKPLSSSRAKSVNVKFLPAQEDITRNTRSTDDRTLETQAGLSVRATAKELYDTKLLGELLPDSKSGSKGSFDRTELIKRMRAAFERLQHEAHDFGPHEERRAKRI